MLVAANNRIASSKALHTQRFSNPRSSGNITIREIYLKRKPHALCFGCRETQHFPPLLRKGIESILTFAMHLVIVDYTTNTGTLVGFKIGSYSFAGSLSFTMKPPYFGASRVSRICKLFPCLLHSGGICHRTRR